MIAPSVRERVLAALGKSPWRGPEHRNRIVVLVDGASATVHRRAWLADELRRGRRSLAHDVLTRRVGAGEVLVLVEGGGALRLELVALEGGMGRAQ